jgi:hypothetical protein
MFFGISLPKELTINKSFVLVTISQFGKSVGVVAIIILF